LRRAADAIDIDSSGLSIVEVLTLMEEKITASMKYEV